MAGSLLHQPKLSGVALGGNMFQTTAEYDKMRFLPIHRDSPTELLPLLRLLLNIRSVQKAVEGRRCSGQMTKSCRS